MVSAERTAATTVRRVGHDGREELDEDDLVPAASADAGAAA
jgi:hypothetical protein